MECKHEFKGHCDGVTCKKCGTKMTAEEYAKYLKENAKNPRQRKGATK